jgi:crossover junction endodeoxyribonuclease RuvC
MTGAIIGIDIGSQGAIALLTPGGDLLEVVDMPILRDGPKGRPNVFGRSRGVIEGVCAAAGLPIAFLTPAYWKRLVGIAPGKEGAKDAARSLALRRWPSHAATFARVKDDGRAEAALIAVAGLMRKGVAP